MTVPTTTTPRRGSLIRTLHVEVDDHLNPYLSPPPWHHLPPWLSRFLGHRDGPQKPVGNVMVAVWSFIGVFSGLAMIEGVGMNIPSFQEHNAPLIVASFGAAAVLEFCVIESPLSQPRNMICGQIIALIVGVSLSKLFALNSRYEELLWLVGALSCATTTTLMTLTSTVHPPAGATALLIAVDPKAIAMGWFIFPVVLLGIALMLSTALVLNNIQRQFPRHWWTPQDLRRKRTLEQIEGVTEGEGGKNKIGSADSSGGENYESSMEEGGIVMPEEGVMVRRGQVLVAYGVELSETEREVLAQISNRI
ncbi:hypothetical protein FQN54_007604 [Arachnomyces sp. PD_36]|nr:hypothetical protein FQN54_007604 [Arachnomyces sp. PD_36]